MSKENVSAALDTFCKQVLGIPMVELDEGGLRCLQFTEDLIVNVQYAEVTDSLLLYSNLGELPGSASPDLLREMLEANFFWRETGGATLSIQPDSKMVMLAYEEPAEATTPERFEEVLKDFAESANSWQQVLSRESTPSHAPGRNVLVSGTRIA